jgi:hypothetical protein
MRYIAERVAKGGETTFERHPSSVIRYAEIWPVTGDDYAASLEATEAAGLFERLLAGLQPVVPNPGRNKSIRQIVRRSWTAPMPEHRVVIRKNPGRRR